MTILYTPRELLEAMRINPLPDRFLRDMLVNRPEVISDKKYIELDKVVSSQAMATYNSRTGNPTIVNKTGFSTAVHVAPYVYEAIPITASDVDVRNPGENIYQSNAGSNLAEKVAMWTRELEDRLSVREEQQVASGIQNGTLTVSGDGVSYTVDFGMPAANKVTLTGGDVWGTTTDMLGQIEDWAKILSNKGYVASKMLLDVNAATLLRNDSTLQGLLNNRRIVTGEINPQVVAGHRASYMGTLNGVGLDIDLYVYLGGYQTDSTTFVNFLSSNKAILIGAGLEIVPCYSKIENLKAAGFRGRAFPNMWIEDSGKEGFITLESGPLMGIRNPEAIVSATVK